MNVKLIVMGQGGVGKSCLTQQFCLNRFVGDSVSIPNALSLPLRACHVSPAQMHNL